MVKANAALALYHRRECRRITRSGMQTQENLRTLIGNVNNTISKNIRQIASSTGDTLSRFKDQMVYISMFMVFGVMVFTIIAGIISGRVLLN